MEELEGRVFHEFNATEAHHIVKCGLQTCFKTAKVRGSRRCGRGSIGDDRGGLRLVEVNGFQSRSTRELGRTDRLL